MYSFRMLMPCLVTSFYARSIPRGPGRFWANRCVWFKWPIFFPINHRISTPGASGNHRGTCGNIFWRYGLNPVHITYSSTRITSISLTCFLYGLRPFCLAWNWFSDLIRGIAQIRSENPFQAKLICSKWGRKPYSGQSIPIRGQA